MNLGKKYKQLFEGKTRSNDGALLTEKKGSALADDIVAELKRNSVLKRLGLDEYSVKVSTYESGAVGGIIMNFLGPELNKSKSYSIESKGIGGKIITAIEKELEKIVGKDYMPMVQVKMSDPKYLRIGKLEFVIFSSLFNAGRHKKSDGPSVIETLADLSTAEIRKIEKSIHIEDGYVEGMDREVNGTIEIAGKEFTWNMDTSDGMSTSYLGDEEDEDYVLHDILIDAVEDAGYALDDEYEDDGSDSWDGS